jgi:Rrf2 family iron-sulfur cluster assembly transcriptional regulator
MLISKSCEYGIRSMIYLATKENHKNLSIAKIADELNISFHFLTKIFQPLTQAGILASFKGPNGGISLNKPADSIRLIDIVHILDGEALFTQCALGLPGCGSAQPCSLHEKWIFARQSIQLMFESSTVGELATKTLQQNLRLSDENVLHHILYRPNSSF